jgi:hypothetical protein
MAEQIHHQLSLHCPHPLAMTDKQCNINNHKATNHQLPFAKTAKKMPGTTVQCTAIV